MTGNIRIYRNRVMWSAGREGGAGGRATMRTNQETMRNRVSYRSEESRKGPSLRSRRRIASVFVKERIIGDSRMKQPQSCRRRRHGGVSSRSMGAVKWNGRVEETSWATNSFYGLGQRTERLGRIVSGGNHGFNAIRTGRKTHILRAKAIDRLEESQEIMRQNETSSRDLKIPQVSESVE